MLRRLIICLTVLTAAFTAAARGIGQPQIPSDLRTPQEQSAFMAMHFWDGLDFADTVRSLDRSVVEEAFSDYAAILPEVSDSICRASVDSLLTRAAAVAPAYRLLLETARVYLYSPDSPVFSEDAYLPFLDFVIARGDDTPADRMIRDDIMRNSPGTPAADFTFETTGGTEATALDPEGRRRTLLIFYDPDCDDCHRLIGRLRKSEALDVALGSGDLRVVLVYIGDDREHWQRDAASLPAAWTVGIDDRGTVDDGDLYVIRATPSVYLIDRDGTVLLKDPTVAAIEAAL